MHLPVNIGLEEESRQKIANGLSRFLADTYTLYLKTHNFHWNVKGPQFQSLHLAFEEQYLDLAEAVDLIAERIRALDFAAPATYREFSKLTSIREPEGVPHEKDMVRELVESHELVTRTAREVFGIAEKASDQVTMDLLIDRMTVHEKTAWMLRSSLEDE